MQTANMSNLTVILAATNAMRRWLSMDLPYLPDTEGGNKGTQAMHSNAEKTSWQCHVIQNHPKSFERTAIATEVNSRYTLLMPFSVTPSREQWERKFLHTWVNEWLNNALELGFAHPDWVRGLADAFVRQPKQLSWYRNVDLSVNGHVTDAELWVRQTLDHNGLAALDDDYVFALGERMNSQIKRVGPMKKSIDPRIGFVEQGLRYFAENSIIQSGSLSTQNPENDHKVMPDNVVSMADFRNRKRN